MTDISKLFTGIGQPDPEPEQKIGFTAIIAGSSRKSTTLRKPRSGPVHTLSREAFLARKAELEAQYVLFPQSRLDNLDPACIIPLVLE